MGITQIGIVAGVILFRENKYLLVQERQPKAFGLWNFPAGHIEEGDTLEQTAIKEAKEETGFDVKIIKKIGIFHENETRPVKHIYYAEIYGGEIMEPNEEIMDLKWLTYEGISQIKNKLRAPWIWECINIFEKTK